MEALILKATVAFPKHCRKVVMQWEAKLANTMSDMALTKC